MKVTTKHLIRSHLLFKNVKNRTYKIIVLAVVLHGCETLSLILRVKHRLRVFEKKVLRRIFRQRRNEVTGGWTKLNNELQYLHSLF
jgi:hypothetical protein